MMDKEFKREILMDHYTRPTNKRTVEDNKYKLIHNASDSCIDDVKVQMNVEDGIIKDVCFDGVGCTISTASTDIMCSLVKGKSISEARKYLDNYYNMINEKEYDEDLLEEANAFDTLYQQANRIKCGTIGINAIRDLLDEYEKR